MKSFLCAILKETNKASASGQRILFPLSELNHPHDAAIVGRSERFQLGAAGQHLSYRLGYLKKG